MKKLISSTLFVVFLLLAGHAGASTAVPVNYLYTLDIDIPDPAMVPDLVRKIAGVEFKLFGGEFETNWNYELGDAVPKGGNWIFETFGNYNAVYDEGDVDDPLCMPMTSGRVLTITSDVALTFDLPVFYDFEGKIDFPEGYYESGGFKETPVPIPGTMVLLGSGLVGVFGLVRRRS
ncbi:MAG: PEP-CTERM sorting domain-containing protein [Desulfobacteraceae bacterium]|nr:PEP-CTERM sorting domain-containing protein [Desulfobacteraceae bacterium]